MTLKRMIKLWWSGRETKNKITMIPNEIVSALSEIGFIRDKETSYTFYRGDIKEKDGQVTELFFYGDNTFSGERFTPHRHIKLFAPMKYNSAEDIIFIVTHSQNYDLYFK